MALRNEQEAGGVVHLPVTKLVTQDSLDFLVRALLEQGVEDDNLLLANPRQSSEVRIAVGTALATVDDLQLREREFELRRKRFDRVLELAGLERLKLVEQWHDEDGVDGHAQNLDSQHEDPQVVEEVLARLPDDGQEGAANGNTERKTESLALDHVRDPGAHRHLVEAVLLLEDEVVVVHERQTDERLSPSHQVDEEKRPRNLTGETDGSIACSERTGDGPEYGVDVEVESREVLGLVEKSGDETELGLCAAVCLCRG